MRGTVVIGKSAPVELEADRLPFTGLQGDFDEGFQFFFRAHHLGASLMDVELHHLFTGHRTGVPNVDFHRQAVRLIEHVGADPQVRVSKRRVTQAEPNGNNGVSFRTS